MPGWRRNHRDSPPAAASPPVAARDDWRTLPPLPTVLRSPVTTVAVETFSDSLGTWRNPSFLAPLGHQIDPDGPAGLVTGLAGASASREPMTYYRDRPLTLAEAAPVPLQRSATSTFPPPARSLLTTAQDVDVDLSPVPLPAVPGEPSASTTSVEVAPVAPDLPANQEPEPPVLPAAPAEPSATDTSRLSEEQPLIAQRQMMATPPPAPPRRRLGLGPPLTGASSGFPLRAAPQPEQPLVARTTGRPVPPAAADGTPPRSAPPRSAPPRPAPPKSASSPGNEPAQARPATASELPLAASAPRLPTPPDPVPAPLAPVQRALPDYPQPHLPAPPHAPAPPHDATPPDAPVPPDDPGPPRPVPAQAPLLGHPQQASLPIQPVTPTIRPPAPPSAATVAPPKEPIPPRPLLASSKPSPSPPAPLAAQRSVTLPDPSPSHGHPTAPSTAPIPPPLPLVDAGPAATAEPSPADPGQPVEPPASVQRDAPALPQLAPLLAHRPPPRVLDVRPDPRIGPEHQQPTAISATTTSVQRAVSVAPPFSRPGRPAPSAALRPAPANLGPLDTYGDPGAIAVARGLAHRDPDGSVVFDLSPATLASSFTPSHQEPAITTPPETGPRQQPAEPHPGPASVTPATTSATPAAAGAAPLATSTAAPDQAPAASGPATTPAAAAGATPPLEELARQLFGPLTARLKAELRLDRERAGLLTDLRQ